MIKSILTVTGAIETHSIVKIISHFLVLCNSIFKIMLTFFINRSKIDAYYFTKGVNLKMPNESLYDKLAEKPISRKEIFDGFIAHLVVDTVTLPNGAEATREVILHNGAVCIVPITKNNEIIMERQFRYPFDEVIWEIPAGKIDKGENDPVAAARRELLEETGYTAGNLKFIGMYYPSPAILSEKIYMYAATDLTLGEQDLDEDEFLDVVSVPFDTVIDMILNNEIPDGKTQSAVLKVKTLLDKGLL